MRARSATKRADHTSPRPRSSALVRVQKSALLALAALLLAYAAIIAHRPTLAPPVGQDEPWIASVAFKLATRGVYGSDVFAGYYGMEHHYYDFMPVYPLLLAGVFELAGVGLAQVRLLPALCGALVLALTFAVGRRLGGWRVGALAGLLLLALRLSARPAQLGIPLLDTAHVGRYDIAVPLFGLLALWLFLGMQDAATGRAGKRESGRAEEQESERSKSYNAPRSPLTARRSPFTAPRSPLTAPHFALAGALAGLAGLTHLYGACWLPALLAALVARRGWRVLLRPAPYLLLAGFVVIWLPWLLYVASDARDYAGQLRIVSERFALLSPGFYWGNWSRELDRYALIDITGRWGLPRPARAGAWMAIAGLPLGAALAIWRWRADRDAPIMAVVVALAAHMLLFALLLQPKTYSYLVGLWPLAALLLAWLGVQLWELRRGALLWRAAVALLLAAALAEGGAHITAARAAPATSYEALGARVAAHIPAGARVLGLHTYWLALRQFPFRSWAVPVLLANGRYNHEETLSFDQALERVGPDVVLVDREMNAFFEALADPAHPQHAWLAQYHAFMRRHGARLVATVEDATYGRIEIYSLLPAPVGPQGSS